MMAFSLDDETLLRKPNDVFTLQEHLGRGAYGVVCKAQHRDSGRDVAIKQVALDGGMDVLLKEIGIMEQLTHPHIVKYYGFYLQPESLWIVMEYLGGGSVGDVITARKRPLGEAEMSVILRDTLQGLAYLHGLRKLHRDLKAANILLDADGEAKLADFGVASQICEEASKRTTLIGTPLWMAPEVIQEVGYDQAADIWSLGITAIEMADGWPPLSNIHPMKAIFMIPLRPPPTVANPRNFSPALNDFIAVCCQKEAKNRPTAEKLLEHPFVNTAHDKSAVQHVIIEAMEKRARHGDSDSDSDYGSACEFSDEGEGVGDSATGSESGSVCEYGANDEAALPETVSEREVMGTVCGGRPDSDFMWQPGQDEFPGITTTVTSTIAIKEKPTHCSQSQSMADSETTDLSVALTNEYLTLSPSTLRKRLEYVEPKLAVEQEKIRQRYAQLRAPILAAIAEKKAMPVLVCNEPGGRVLL